jgi:hypothetical protein
VLYLACSTSPSIAVTQKNIIRGLLGSDGDTVHLTQSDKDICILATITAMQTPMALAEGTIKIGTDTLCTSCQEEMCVGSEAKFWDELPSVFGLLSWEDITKEI